MPNIEVHHIQVHRLRDSQRQQFRWAPHTTGVTLVKPKDYNAAEAIAAGGVYEAWRELRESERPLGVGDVLELEGGQLRIYKYVGFEEAQWALPEPVPVAVH